MLAALDNGVQGGRWYSLMDKVASPRTLAAAWKRVAANKGAARWMGSASRAFGPAHHYYLAEVERELRAGAISPCLSGACISRKGRENPAPGDYSGQRSHRADGDHHGRGAHL